MGRLSISQDSIIVFFILLFLGCGSLPAQTSKNELANTSKEVLKLIKSADFGRLSEYVNESKGLQFSPYDDVYENGPDATKFSKQNVKNFMTIAHYSYKGSPANGFCDLKKLTLVFEKIEKKWFLIGIIHGEKGV